MIYREITPKIQHWLGKGKVLIIKGSRQVGKTTLLKHLEGELRAKGEYTYFASVDRELGDPIFENSKNLIRFLKGKFPNLSPEKKLYVFLDEFQFLHDAGLFLKTFFDETREYIQPIVSGSSSLEIAKSSEFLTGRSIEFFLYPLSYGEFFHFKTGYRLPETVETFEELIEVYALHKRALDAYMLEYCTFGGYPEVVTTQGDEDKQVILKTLVRTYIEKDIIAFFRLEHVAGFQNLLKILASQIGNMVNKSELANTANMSMETINKYLDILEGTYVLERVRPYFSNVRKEISKMPKVYFNDLGLRNVILNTLYIRSSIDGAELENIAYNALKMRYDRENLYYYRTIAKSEIDFIVSTGGTLIPVEVKGSFARTPSVFAMFKKQYPSTSSYGVLANPSTGAVYDNAYAIPISVLAHVDLGRMRGRDSRK